MNRRGFGPQCGRQVSSVAETESIKDCKRPLPLSAIYPRTLEKHWKRNPALVPRASERTGAAASWETGEAHM